MTFSRSTLMMFAELLGQVQLSAAADNFDELAANVSLARRELTEALKELPVILPVAEVS
jgi:hypothetical protein